MHWFFLLFLAMFALGVEWTQQRTLNVFSVVYFVIGCYMSYFEVQERLAAKSRNS